MAKKPDLYASIIDYIFKSHWSAGVDQFEFHRDEMIEAANALGIARPDNLGDLIYSFKFRRELPATIRDTAQPDKTWLLEGAGYGRYRFRLVAKGGNTFTPREDLLVIKVPDATPEIIGRYALGDEQALLARLRYNRLIDVFLGITSYSLQNHLRTQIEGMGQIEIDEIYVGLNRNGAHFVVPVQAKGGSDRLSPVQTLQDLACCRLKFPNMVCRPVSAQFMNDDVIALFEMSSQNGSALVVEERHYKLVPSADIDAGTLQQYADRS